MEIRFSEQAKSDLSEMHDYIAVNLGSPQSAQTMVERVVHAIDNLRSFPKLGGQLKNKFFAPDDYRFLVCENHVVIYRVKDDCIAVLRVLDGRSDYLAHLGYLDER